ncbi:Uma2 family endonuclease [Pseudonocardia sp. TRM90224]|uniref:Uma2 family endonuclease n=1 Tax=Pseudonocardia sp. TRM90224 TaxID=2812678 RepID=UPI001E4F23A7|nr:Uma2 family endonuclease [Pseudonocardia sp. TRM90224]
MVTPIPHELMTLDDWDALPEDNSAQYELQDGVLVVSPKPALRHQEAQLELAVQIRQQLPRDHQVVGDFELVVKAGPPPTVRAPDLIVIPRGGPQKRAETNAVRIAIEIISPGSRSTDKHLKVVEYAEAGIPWFWLVDLDPPAPTITVFGFGAPDDGYVESQTAVGELVVREPFPLRIDIGMLLGPASW